jgi:hypothetical protein
MRINLYTVMLGCFLLAGVVSLFSCESKEDALKKNIGKTAILRSWGGKELYVYMDPDIYHTVSKMRMANDSTGLEELRDKKAFYSVSDQTPVNIRNYGEGCYYVRIMSGDKAGDLVAVPIDYVKFPE